MKNIHIAILGFGVVGSGVYALIQQNKKDYEHREGLTLNVKRVLIRGFDCEPNIDQAPRSVYTLSVADIAADPDISIVVECMGGIEPAKSFVTECLLAGKTVVTSNKELVAKHWPELESAAKKGGAGFYLEASVGGGIPLLRTIGDSLQGNNILSVMGIINGTTNYILSGMESEGSGYDAKLKEAQGLGFAEANPEADVEGWDAAYKLSIMGSMAFHARVPVEKIFREGITKIAAQDFSNARLLGYTIKLLAIGKKRGNRIEARVHPTMIPLAHPLAAVRSNFNAVYLNGDAVGDVMLYGQGAGRLPTASAILGDVIYAAHRPDHRYQTFQNEFAPMDPAPIEDDWSCAFAVRVTTQDRVGVLAQISSCFAKHDISLLSVLQQPAEAGLASILFITHVAREKAMQAALAELGKSDAVKSVDSVIRVENGQ